MTSAPPLKPPKPLLLRHKEIDALYETLDVLSSSLRSLQIPFFLIAGESDPREVWVAHHPPP